MRKRVEKKKGKANIANRVKRKDRKETLKSTRDIDLGFEEREEIPKSARDIDLGYEKREKTPEITRDMDVRSEK